MTDFYTPIFSPWRGYGNFEAVLRECGPHTLLSADRLFILWSLAQSVRCLDGDLIECGVYKGGSAKAMAMAGGERPIYLMDTFGGMPTPGVEDTHAEGDFADTDAGAVAKLVGEHRALVFKGKIPETFDAIRGAVFSLAHVDVDLYWSVVDCCDFLYPRLVPGGVMVFDDYGFATTKGARQAVDEFCASLGLFPLVLPTGQALVFRRPL